jgi:hypothetical protein
MFYGVNFKLFGSDPPQTNFAIARSDDGVAWGDRQQVRAETGDPFKISHYGLERYIVAQTDTDDFQLFHADGAGNLRILTSPDGIVWPGAMDDLSELPLYWFSRKWNWGRSRIAS